MPKLFVIGLIALASTNVYALGSYRKDSSAVSNIVSEFFHWYITATKEQRYAEFQPEFVESAAGMTTLDFSIYVANLKKYKWSDEFIGRELKSYQECIGNLAKVKFSEFGKTTFTDLDEYEQAKCDFGNSYKWISSQEPFDGVRVAKVHFIRFMKPRSARVTIDVFDYDETKNEYYYHGDIDISLVKVNRKWKITGIGPRKNQF